MFPGGIEVELVENGLINNRNTTKLKVVKN